MDASKLLKGMVSGEGAILVPYIDIYQAKGDFPAKWQIEVRNTKPDDGWFHPSAHPFTPPRVLYYDRGLAQGKIKLEGEYPLLDRGISASLRRTFDNGNMWHEYLGQILVEMGFVRSGDVERHVELRRTDAQGVRIVGSGTADLIDVAIPGQGKWLVDMKTMNKRDFEQRQPRADTFKKWEAQVNLYMEWTGAERAMILAIEKDSPHRLREFQIEHKPQLVQEIYERWATAQAAIDAGEPPPCEHPFTGEPCGLAKFCSHLTMNVAPEDHANTRT